jgi:hypothetical protein
MNVQEYGNQFLKEYMTSKITDEGKIIKINCDKRKTHSIGTTRPLDIAVPAAQHARKKYTTRTVSNGLNNI